MSGRRAFRLRSSQCRAAEVAACGGQLGGQRACCRADMAEDSRDETDVAGPKAHGALKADGGAWCEVSRRGLSGYDLLFKRVPLLLR